MPAKRKVRIPGNSTTKSRIHLTKRGATRRKEDDEFACLTGIVKAHQQKLDSEVPKQPDVQPAKSSCDMDSPDHPIRKPASVYIVHVSMMGGKTLEVQADPQELVAHLRRRIAKVVDKPLTQLVLTLDTCVLHGRQLVGAVAGNSECIHISAFLSETCGPVEEWMDEKHPEGLTEYMPELYGKLKTRECEAKACISSAYMAQQEDINSRMRAILVDWLVEVHMKYRMGTLSLGLCVQLMDRYLQAKQVHRKRLQLVGIVALFIASKFEDLHHSSRISLDDLKYISADQFSKEVLARMEVDMLTTLGFDLCSSTVGHFMNLYKQANRCDDDHGFAVQYLIELAFLDMELASQPPSLIAAAATLLSNQLLQRDLFWPEGMASYTGYSEDALQAVSQKMRELLAGAATSQLNAVYRKFNHPSWGDVAVKLTM